MFQLNQSSWEVFYETMRLSPLIWKRICRCHPQWSRASWVLRLNSIQWVSCLSSACLLKTAKRLQEGSHLLWNKIFPLPLYWKELKCYESLQKTKNAKSVVFEHLRIKCPGQELPLGLAGLTVIIKAKSRICSTEKKWFDAAYSR